MYYYYYYYYYCLSFVIYVYYALLERDGGPTGRTTAFFSLRTRYRALFSSFCS